MSLEAKKREVVLFSLTYIDLFLFLPSAFVFLFHSYYFVHTPKKEMFSTFSSIFLQATVCCNNKKEYLLFFPRYDGISIRERKEFLR
jgi:hypothetical protein